MFFEFLKQVWDLWVERCRSKKALRMLNKQVWSVEFLTELLIMASKKHGPLEMTIISPNGAKIVVNTIDTKSRDVLDDNIFNHLDDDIRVSQFVETMRGNR